MSWLGRRAPRSNSNPLAGLPLLDWWRPDRRVSVESDAITGVRGYVAGMLIAQASPSFRPLLGTAPEVGELPSIEYDGVDDVLVSNLPASAWAILHNGSGAEVHAVVVFRDVNAGSARRLVSTYTNTNGPGLFIGRPSAVPRLQYTITDGVGAIINPSTIATGAEQNAPHHIWGGYNSALSPAQYLYGVDAASASGDASGPPSVANPQSTLRVGGSGSSFFMGSLLDLIITNRRPTTDERARLDGYIEDRYGVAAP